MNNKLLTVEEVAEILRLEPATVLRLYIKTEKLPHVILSGNKKGKGRKEVRCWSQDIEKFLQERYQPAKPRSLWGKV